MPKTFSGLPVTLRWRVVAAYAYNWHRVQEEWKHASPADLERMRSAFRRLQSYIAGEE